MGVQFEASGTLPIELPINVSAKLNKNRAGQYCIKIKYLPMDKIDQIKRLAELHENGSLTDQEFSNAKKRIIERL